ncbi:FAD-dependent oxidoreductase [Colwellia sp. RE-S-Sl-9]
MTALINTLYNKLNPNNIKTSHAVIQVKQENGSWTVTVKQQGNTVVFKANNLILALPPRMIIQHLTPTNWASISLQKALKQVPTWMAAQAKFIATYPTPFWREQSLSGQAFSQQGPMQEIHDACANNEPSYALFGFIGIPAISRSQYSEAQIKQACLSQLALLYGEQAKKVENTYFKDWATSEYITSELDLNEPPQHPYFDSKYHQKELTEKKIFLVGSEFSTIDAGYLEGAVCAVNDVINKIP